MRWSDIQFDPPRKVLRNLPGFGCSFSGDWLFGRSWGEDEQGLGGFLLSSL